MSRKDYIGDDVTVSFDGAVCAHSRHCIEGLPEVFDLAKRPWIAPDAVLPERVVALVEGCPSGALRIERFR